MQSKSAKIIGPALIATTMGVSSVMGTTITTPAGLAPGSKFYLMFVSVSTTDATSNDPSVYNTLVNNDASTYGLTSYGSDPSINWQALASYDGGSDAASIFPADPNAPVYLLDGTQIAAKASDLWTTGPESAIDIDASGTQVSTDVWTGTDSSGSENSGIAPKGIGTKGTNGTAGSTEYGDSSSVGSNWIEYGDDTNDSYQLPVYAFSDELTVPGTSIVPLPSSAAMGAAGAALLAAYIASRKLSKRRPV